MTKVIVQIPCFNEAGTLAETVADIPRSIPGVDTVEVLIVDDGSSDGTADVARSCGVDHIVRHRRNLGLARTFRTGIEACLALGADIVVNTDGDNQYAGKDVARLVEPILEGAADIVVGDRQTQTIAHFSASKKLLQRVGSSVVRRFSEIEIPDAVSGFRAFSRDAALKLNVLSRFSYTIETLIQSGHHGLTVTSVPVGTNPKTRDSRLFKSIPNFLERSVSTMLRAYTMYQPLRVMMLVGTVLVVGGVAPIARFLWLKWTGEAGEHIQSLVLGAALVTLGFAVYVVGVLADLISFNRQLLETTLEKVKRLELEQLARERDGRDDD